MNTVTNFNHRSAIITEALTVAKEHMAWAARQPGGMKLAAYGIGRPELGETTYHYNKRRAIIAAAVAAEWMGMPKI